jgi:LPS-assembly protein
MLMGLILAIFLALGLFLPGVALAQDAAPGDRVHLVINESEPPITIDADQVVYSEDMERVEFFGNVVIRRGEEMISGDMALWHEPTGSAEISGSVFFSTPDFRASARRAAVNMDLRLAKIYDGRAFFPERHYYIYGTVLERQGPETLYVRDGIFTTCDGPEPSWSLTAERLLVNREGFAESTGVVFKNPYFPMLYIPWLLVPVKTERQTGFLIPQIASTSRDGAMVALPFFWALSEDYDLTILPVYRSKRGVAITLEARYNLNVGEGIWLGTFMRDSKDNLYNYQSPGLPQANSKSLYWLRAQNNWQVADWDLNLDLDIVSDPLMLYAFRNDLDGFYYSRNLFNQYFGRTVNEELDPLRLSTFFAQKSGEDTYFRGSLVYTDNLYRHNNVDTLQNMPSLYFSLVSRPVTGKGATKANIPRFGLDLRYDYYTRRLTDASVVDETGHRFFAQPSLFWHTDLLNTFSLNTDAYFNLTAYAPTGHRPLEHGREMHDNFESSLSGGFEVELSTALSRIYESEDEPGEALLHQFVPTVSFVYVEAEDQDKMPYFDLFDRTLKQRTIRFGFWNTFTKREVTTGENGELTFDYRELLKLGVFHSYEFASNISWAEKDWARYYTTGYFERGVGPWELELEAYLNPWVTARILSSLDGRTREFTTHDVSLTLADLRGDSFSLIYDYKKPSLEYGPANFHMVNQARADLHLNFTHGWSTSVASRYDFADKRGLDTAVRVTYADQCYGISVVWEDSGDDTRIALVVDLLGLGSFGNAATAFADPIPEPQY